MASSSSIISSTVVEPLDALSSSTLEIITLWPYQLGFFYDCWLCLDVDELLVINCSSNCSSFSVPSLFTFAFSLSDELSTESGWTFCFSGNPVNDFRGFACFLGDLDFLGSFFVL